MTKIRVSNTSKEGMVSAFFKMVMFTASSGSPSSYLGSFKKNIPIKKLDQTGKYIQNSESTPPTKSNTCASVTAVTVKPTEPQRRTAPYDCCIELAILTVNVSSNEIDGR
ncbi:hypothetical protein PBN151_4506 [Paenibacillus sp. NAIST15-1]|nr:hypothetical protein PBN151_4506 [Paenibacillus sp. NAIST15-1]